MIDDKNADDEGDDENPTQEELDQAVEDADDDLPATFLRRRWWMRWRKLE